MTLAGSNRDRVGDATYRHGHGTVRAGVASLSAVVQSEGAQRTIGKQDERVPPGCRHCNSIRDARHGLKRRIWNDAHATFEVDAFEQPDRAVGKAHEHIALGTECETASRYRRNANRSRRSRCVSGRWSRGPRRRCYWSSARCDLV